LTYRNNSFLQRLEAIFMKQPFRTSAAMLSIISLIATGHAYADKPTWAGGGGKEHGHGNHSDERGGNREDDRSRQGDHAEGRHSEVRVHGYFNDRQRGYVREYYGEEFRRGQCPPGLAKKHNGCMPPGQAKKWRRGYPLGRDVVYYDVPPSLIVQLGYPPEGHRYVRVASDILLIAVGSSMVVDAIEDINQ
jgi:Ni/Co efflux regulator RcnB